LSCSDEVFEFGFYVTFVFTCLGSVLWEAKSEHFVATWSSFNVAVMPDFTGDGVPELITAHSSDPRFPPEVNES